MRRRSAEANGDPIKTSKNDRIVLAIIMRSKRVVKRKAIHTPIDHWPAGRFEAHGLFKIII
jgi:hypothetical protein